MVTTVATACGRVPWEEATTTSIKHWPAGKAAHQSTGAMVYKFCLMIDVLEVGFLVAFGQAGAVARGEAGFFETGLGVGDVIGNTTMYEEALL